MVCEMQIDARGHLLAWQFYESVIHSHARLTYTEVGEVLTAGECATVPPERVDDLRRLHQLYRVLRAARDVRGAIDFDTVETRIIFDADRKIEAIVPVVRNDAHKLIEECMLIANVATANTLEASDLPALYRVHDGPSAERLENLRAFLGELALDLPGGMTPTPEDYQSLISQLHDREDASVIQTMLLRSLSQAMYQPDNGGHFGLHYPAYANFTSPIRRYPDLLVHRALRFLIRSDQRLEHVRRVPGVGVLKRQAIYPYDTPAMAALGEHCSMTERRADDATREVDAWLKCEFLRDKIGEVYPGVIAAVTRFGVFVELQDLYIEGLVHISALPGDYYQYDQAKQRLVGERTRRSFQLGGSVTVQVVRVDLDDRKIDLELADGGVPAARVSDTGADSRPAKSGRRRSGSGTKEKEKASARGKPGAKAKGGDKARAEGKAGAKRGAKGRGKRR
jgi:ribonuclease R